MTAARESIIRLIMLLSVKDFGDHTLDVLEGDESVDGEQCELISKLDSFSEINIICDTERAGSVEEYGHVTINLDPEAEELDGVRVLCMLIKLSFIWIAIVFVTTLRDFLRRINKCLF